jgi:tripartite-type tricarboxylate transporter receptor subunit TctC
MVANNIGKHLPGKPSVVVQYMPGAGGLKATNYLYNAAAKDGSFAGMVTKDLVVAQTLRPGKVKYDARKFNWVGRINEYVAVIIVMNGRGIKTFADLKKKQTIMGVSGRNHHGYLLASMLNKLVTGYRGAKAMNFTMEGGEVDARIGSSMTLKTQLAAQIRDGKMRAIVQSGEQKAMELPNIPLVNTMFTNPADRQVAQLIDSGTIIGWSVLMPPGVPGDRVAAWRASFNKLATDATLQSRAKKAKADLNFKTGQQIASFVDKVLSTDPSVFARTRKLVGIKNNFLSLTGGD